MSSDLESRLAAVEAELAAIKAKLGLTAPEFRLPPQPEPQSGGLVAPRSSAEVRLASYWVTRIGAMLVLLGAIFLAAYRSLHSTPMARMGHLCILSLVTFGVGHWQQSSANRRFGLVLLSLADALLFFTAFAAYAFEPTKVVGSIGVAVTLQALAAAFVCGHAFLRRSEGSATFALVLFCWVSGFSLNYQHSDITFGFILAIALLAAAFRYRLQWRFPLGFAAVACPILCYAFSEHFTRLQPLLQATLATLPWLLALPIALDRTAPTRGDRVNLLLAAVATLLITAALHDSYLRHAFEEQYLWDTLGLGAIGALMFFIRSETSSLRCSIAVQATFLASVSAALYLNSRLAGSPAIPVAILAVGLASAFGLRRHRKAVPGPWWILFAAIALLWHLHRLRYLTPQWQPGDRSFDFALLTFALSGVLFQVAFGDLPLAELAVAAGLPALADLLLFHARSASPSAELLTLVAIAAIAVASAAWWRAAIPWVVAAIAMAHLAVALAFADPGGGLWLPALAILAVADALILAFAPPLQQSTPHPAAIFIPLAMLGVLDYGYAMASRSWSATFAWVPLAGGVFLLGFLKGNPGYRIAALLGFAACLIRLFTDDLHSTFTRIFAFFLVGGILLGIGYLYTRLSRKA